MLTTLFAGRRGSAAKLPGPGRSEYAGGFAIILLFSLLGCAGGGGGGQPPPGGPSPQPPTIAFVSSGALDGSDAKDANGNFNLWIIHADGTGATPLTKLNASNANILEPAWSPDGSRIAFTSRQALDGSDAITADLVFNIWVMKSDGTGITPLTRLTATGTSSFFPVWSPDGSKIAFISSRALDQSDAANWEDNIWVMNADGSGARALTTLTARGAGPALAAAWSPSGSQIAFSCARALDGSDAANANGVINVWVMSADGTGAKPLTRLTASGIGSFDPAWSPDSAKLAFASNRALDGSDALLPAVNLWVMNADGSAAAPLTTLTASGVDGFGPAWSPNGAKLTVTSSRAIDGSDATNSAFNVWILNNDGTGATALTRLTVANIDSFGAVWSSDSSMLAFSSARALDGSNAANANRTHNVWLIKTDGTGATPLTNLTALGADIALPAWRP